MKNGHIRPIKNSIRQFKEFILINESLIRQKGLKFKTIGKWKCSYHVDTIISSFGSEPRLSSWKYISQPRHKRNLDPWTNHNTKKEADDEILGSEMLHNCFLGCLSFLLVGSIFNKELFGVTLCARLCWYSFFLPLFYQIFSSKRFAAYFRMNQPLFAVFH